VEIRFFKKFVKLNPRIDGFVSVKTQHVLLSSLLGLEALLNDLAHVQVGYLVFFRIKFVRNEVKLLEKLLGL
jgi:hypothetical protein